MQYQMGYKKNWYGVSVSVLGIEFQYQLTKQDLSKVFHKYGDLQDIQVSADGSSAKIYFSSYTAAETSIRDLNGKVLNQSAHAGGSLLVQWADRPQNNYNRPSNNNNYQQGQQPNAHLFANSGKGGGYGGYAQNVNQNRGSYNQKGAMRGVSNSSGGMGSMISSDDHLIDPEDGTAVKKYTCRIDIGLQNDGDFQVARKLIGVKGANMKKIVAQANAKLRLRGRDSGYLEGMGRQESSEPMHLCISCCNYYGYQQAKKMALEIITQMYREYAMYKEAQGMPLQFMPNAIVTEHPVIHSTAERIQEKVKEYHTNQAKALQLSPHPNENFQSARYSNPIPSPPRQTGGSAAGPVSIQLDQDSSETKVSTFSKSADVVEVRNEKKLPSPAEIERQIEKRGKLRSENNFNDADLIKQELLRRGVQILDESSSTKGETTSWRYLADSDVALDAESIPVEFATTPGGYISPYPQGGQHGPWIRPGKTQLGPYYNQSSSRANVAVVPQYTNPQPRATNNYDDRSNAGRTYTGRKIQNYRNSAGGKNKKDGDASSQSSVTSSEAEARSEQLSGRMSSRRGRSAGSDVLEGRSKTPTKSLNESPGNEERVKLMISEESQVA